MCEVECDSGVKAACHSRDCSGGPVSTAGLKVKQKLLCIMSALLTGPEAGVGWDCRGGGGGG